MSGILDSHAAVLASRRWRWSVVVVCLIAALAAWQPVVAQEGSPVPGAVADEQVPYEYVSMLVQWDPDNETYVGADEEGTFGYLLSIPEADGWEFVTILTESWTETTVDEQQAWDVFRWRAIYRRPMEFSDESVE